MIKIDVDNVHKEVYNQIKMKEVRFNKEKNELLKLQRGINFDDISEIIKNNSQIKTIDHPNKRDTQNKKYYWLRGKSIFTQFLY